MSYARVLDAGTYIWSDGENIHFDLDIIPEDKLNIFLAKLSKEEFNDRIKKGKSLIEQFKVVEVNDNEDL